MYRREHESSYRKAGLDESMRFGSTFQRKDTLDDGLDTPARHQIEGIRKLRS